MDFSNSKFESKNSNKPSKRRKKHTKMEIKIDPNSLLPSDIGRRFGDKIISLMTEADIEQRYKTCGILIFYYTSFHLTTGFEPSRNKFVIIN